MSSRLSFQDLEETQECQIPPAQKMARALQELVTRLARQAARAHVLSSLSSNALQNATASERKV